MVSSYRTFPYNFGAIDSQFSSYEAARVVIFPISYDSTTTYRGGALDGPMSIIQASRNLELYDAELELEPYKIGIHTLDEVELSMNGPKETIGIIRKVVSDLIESGKFPVAIGGEHSISTGVVLALKDKYPGLHVLDFDAHPDLRNEYTGTQYSHACTMRRIAEICPVTQVGVRAMSREEAEYLGREGMTIFWAHDVLSKKKGLDDIVPLLGDDVYVSVDLDVLDPSEMPSVGNPEPGGLSWYQLLDLLRGVSKYRRIVGFDVVELSPIRDNVAPDFLAAKLIYKMIGYVFEEEIRRIEAKT